MAHLNVGFEELVLGALPNGHAKNFPRRVQLELPDLKLSCKDPDLQIITNLLSKRRQQHVCATHAAKCMRHRSKTRLQGMLLPISGHVSRPQPTLPVSPVANRNNAHCSWPVKRP